MITFLSPRTLAILVSLFVAVACSSSSTGTGSGGSSERSGTSGTSDGVPSNCVDTCTAQASQCRQDTTRCSQLCGSITGTQYTCIQAAGCDQDRATDCLKGGSSSGSSDASSGGTPACIKLGNSGCNSLNAPSNCCAVSDRPDIVCNGNNDGKDHAQCCVNAGKTCKESSDCCGNAANPTLIKCCPDGKCGFGAAC